MAVINFLNKALVQKQTALKHANLYVRIREGKFPSPVKIGRMSVWIDKEINAVCRAHAAGFSDDQLKELVARLEAERKNFSAEG